MKIFVGFLTILATLLGVFAQDIAYFLTDTALLNVVTAVTVLSVVLFIVAILLAFKQRLSTYATLIAVIAIGVSGWSIFVVLMWWS